MIKKITSFILTIGLIAFVSGILQVEKAYALSFSSVKDTMTSQAKAATSDHTLTWTLGTGHTTALNATITVDFVDADIVTSGTWQTTDFAFSDNVRSASAPASVGTNGSPASCAGSAADNYIVNVTAATSTFVITTCTGWTTSATATPTTFVIKGASGGTGILTNANADTNSSVFTITNGVNDTDSGTGVLVIETNDVVTVTATVNPTLTLAISSATASLGTITASTTGKATHTAEVSTNNPGGFLLTYYGDTLKSGGNSIAAYGGGSPQPSTPGTAGFGINLKANTGFGANLTQNSGTCDAVASDYNTADAFSYVATTTTNLTNQTHVADCTYTVSYVANVASTTPAGNYSTTLTYVASTTF